MEGLVGRTLGRYRLVEQIGQGGMSQVFRAVDSRHNHTVAVKTLAPYLAHDAKFRARFAREVKILGGLQHPNIMPISDFGEAEGLAFIVMPYIASGTLSMRLAKGPVDAPEAGRIVEQLASALAAAHEAGVIHRDVKPSNILLGVDGHVLLSDFSFAHDTDALENLTGSAMIGTPAYMSPEQCSGGAIDARSDQYSMAVVVYQMATGQLPFDAVTPMATALKHVNEPLPPPRLVNPRIPDEVEMVLVRALAKDPALRYPSVLEMNAAFQEALRIPADSSRRQPTTSAAARLAAYNKLQNVRPQKRPRLTGRTALAVAVLLLLACPVTAAGTAVLFPGLLSGAGSAGQSTPDVAGTVDAIVAYNVLRLDLPRDVLQTQVFLAVMQTLVATGAPVGDEDLEAIEAAGTSTVVSGLIFPTSTPTESRTPKPGASPVPPTPTPVPPTTEVPSTETPTPATPTETPQPTDTPTDPPTDTPTDPPTDTPTPADTNTPQPTDTPLPPTNTPNPTDTPEPPAETPIP